MFKYLAAGVLAAYAAYQIFFADDQDDRPPSRSQPPAPRRVERQPWVSIGSNESSQPPVRRRVEQQPWVSIGSNESSQPPVHRRVEQQPRVSIGSNESSQPPVRRRVEQQPRVSIDSSESSQPPVRPRDERQHRESIDSSQRDYTPSEISTSLRARAKREGDLMSQCYQQSQDAYQRGDHPHAKALSEEGKRHAAEVENLNAKASAIIFRENNQDRAAYEVDLHGLFVKEAIAYSEKAIAEACRRGDSEIHLIVGQGTHSDGGVSRLKPAIQKDMETRGLHVEVHPTNPGVLIVEL